MAGHTHDGDQTHDHDHDGQDHDEAEEVIEEIHLDITDEGLVWVQGTEWEFFLSPMEARELAKALKEMADEAEEA
jgi:ABC-type Zn2+ transport system substrate-binding protein/surface adhesin